MKKQIPPAKAADKISFGKVISGQQAFEIKAMAINAKSQPKIPKK